MAFIRRKKTSANRTVYQVVQSTREGKQVRQQVLVSLGYSPTIAEAIASAEKRVEESRGGYNHMEVKKAIQPLLSRLRQVQANTGLP